MKEIIMLYTDKKNKKKTKRMSQEKNIMSMKRKKNQESKQKMKLQKMMKKKTRDHRTIGMKKQNLKDI